MSAGGESFGEEVIVAGVGVGLGFGRLMMELIRKLLKCTKMVLACI